MERVCGCNKAFTIFLGPVLESIFQLEVDLVFSASRTVGFRIPKRYDGNVWRGRQNGLWEGMISILLDVGKHQFLLMQFCPFENCVWSNDMNLEE